MASRDGETLVAGVDMGGTKILAAIIDGDHRVLGRAKSPTPAQEGEQAILAAVADTIKRAAVDAGISMDQVRAIGMGSPGPLDPDRGVILSTANLNVRNFPIGPELTELLGPPVLLQNDVRVGTYGEFKLGAGRGYRNLLAAFVGTGIGGCVIIEGEVVTGSTGNSGEIGHMLIKPGGPKCGCGRRGCLEAFASRTSMARRIGKAIRKGKFSVLGAKVGSKPEKLKSKDLAAAYHQNDAVAVAEVHRAGHYLGLGLGGLVNILCPEVVIIGGGVTAALGESFLDVIRNSARMQILIDPDDTISFVPASLGDDAGILGAALLARERLLVAPAYIA